MPDGFVYLFAVYHESLKGLSEELISENIRASVKLSGNQKRFMTGFDELHSLFAGFRLRNLTEREREIALLAARGLRTAR